MNLDRIGLSREIQDIGSTNSLQAAPAEEESGNVDMVPPGALDDRTGAQVEEEAADDYASALDALDAQNPQAKQLKQEIDTLDGEIQAFRSVKEPSENDFKKADGTVDQEKFNEAKTAYDTKKAEIKQKIAVLGEKRAQLSQLRSQTVKANDQKFQTDIAKMIQDSKARTAAIKAKIKKPGNTPAKPETPQPQGAPLKPGSTQGTGNPPAQSEAVKKFDDWQANILNNPNASVKYAEKGSTAQETAKNIHKFAQEYINAHGNNDGDMSFDEYKAFIRQKMPNLSESEFKQMEGFLKTSFDSMDLDGKDGVKADEFAAYIMALDARDGKMDTSISGQSVIAQTGAEFKASQGDASGKTAVSSFKSFMERIHKDFFKGGQQ